VSGGVSGETSASRLPSSSATSPAPQCTRGARGAGSAGCLP
jgi:hypothetical protein